ncbi:putative serine protease K12H4.7 [Anticarsia gemmatalis]|uniref:putative serine protease K12H4.7 n=1 Tax=Anticarsia gemmatalis TaxID=129554 RepID=UPI003F75A02C
MIIFLLLAGLISSSLCAREGRLLLETSLQVDLQPPIEYTQSTRNVFISWVNMPLDHFDPQNNATFRMRFMYNEDFFGGNGSPIFILVGGEWAINAGWLRGGNMFEMARENRGYQIYTEHRYYGETIPFADFSAENLRFLNIDQALADLAYFINDLKKQPRFANSKVILYGGSYAANMVMWFKKRYPHLVLGSVASSGPILAKVNFHEYLEVVHEAFFLEGGEQCISTIRQGLLDTVAAMQTESGRRSVEQAYRICHQLDYDNRFDLAYFSGLITWTFSGAVQGAVPGSLLGFCNNFNTTLYGNTPMEKIGGFIAAYRGLGNQCWTIRYEDFIAGYMPPSISRAWYYQTCTEYGFFQIAPSSGTAFDPLKWLDVEFYVDVCKRIFDERFDEAFVYDAAERVNLIFGGLSPAVNNTINIHGYIDPWRALGVYDEHIGETSPTYNVARASHCFDMRTWARTDTIRMTAVQQAARRLVASWLSQ